MIRRLLIASLVLATAFACGGGSTSNNTSGSTGTPATTAPASSSSSQIFKEAEYSIAPATLTLKAGTYTFEVDNIGQFPHDLHVAASADGTEVGGSTVVMGGKTTSFTVTLKPGTYTLWCGVDGHRSLGMQGTLTVQ